MKTLAIETSCDDTSLGIVELKNGSFEPVKVLLHSQIDKHRKFGGVVPELASRLHEEKIMDLLEEIGLEEIKNVDFISYTCCPGLPGSLLVGTTLANTLAKFLNKEKVPVHHIQGHIFSIFVERKIDEIEFPLIVLTVSGGHNELYLVLRSEEETKVRRENLMWKLEDYLERFSASYWLPKEDLVQEVGWFKLYKLWFTLDDAAWEAFDKVSKMLWWPYPWWKWIYDKALESWKWKVESNASQVGTEKWIVKNNLEWWRNNRERWNSHAELVSTSDSQPKVGIAECYENLWLSPNNQSPKSPQNPKISEDFSFPRIWLKKDEFNFSFSGLKAQVNYKIQELEKKYWKITSKLQAKVAYEFQEAVVETLGKKLLKAAKFFDVENIAVVGGVSANLRLKEYIQQNIEKFWVKNFYTPVKSLYSTDNAAMIGVVGLLKKM